MTDQADGDLLQAGTAVYWDVAGARARLGVLTTHVKPGDNAVVIPFASGTLLRDAPRIAAIAGSVRALQADSGQPPPRAPFDPIVRWRRGTVFAVPVDDSEFFDFYEIAKDVVDAFGQEPNFEESLRARTFDLEKSRGQDVVNVTQGRNTSAVTLAITMELQFANPPDRFLDVLETPLLLSWESEEVAAIAEFPNDRVDVAASVQLADGQTSLRLRYDPKKWPPDAGPFDVADVIRRLHSGAVTPRSANWDATHAVVTSGFTEDGVLTAKANSLRVKFCEGKATATRLVIRGGTLKGFSHRVFSRQPDPFELLVAANAYKVTVFGVPARIYQAQENYIAVVHEGEPLEDDKQSALRNLVAYLVGKRLGHESTERFNGSTRLSYEYFGRAESTQQAAAPLRIDYWSNTPRLLGESFDAILQRMHELYCKKPIALDAAMHHYFEGVNSGFPVSRTLQLAVAVDTLVALVIGNDGESLIVDKSDFKRLIKPVRKALKESLKTTKLSDRQKSQLQSKLDGLNKASAKQRQATFWASVGIDLTEEEQKVLDTRHQVVHEGHLGSEHAGDALWENYRRSNILANLFNRALLSLLGWSGNYRNANIPHEERPL